MFNTLSTIVSQALYVPRFGQTLKDRFEFQLPAVNTGCKDAKDQEVGYVFIPQHSSYVIR